LKIDREAAKAAGWTDEQIDAYEKKAQPATTKTQPKPTESSGSPLFQQMLHGATFGWADNIQAALEAPFSRDEGESITDTYRRRQQEIDQNRQYYASQNPGKAFVAEFAPALLTGGGVAKIIDKGMQGANALSKMMTTGAVEGGIYGSGTAEPGEAVTSGVQEAAIGSLLAPVVAGAAKKTAQYGGGLLDWGRRKLTDTPEKEARRFVQKVGLDYDMRTPDQIADEVERIGAEGVLADTSSNLQGAARAAAAEMGPARMQAETVLRGRQPGQQQRVMETTSRELGGILGSEPDDLAKAIDRIKAARAEQASPFYSAAYDTPFQPTGVLADILKTPTGKQAYKKGLKKARDERINLEPDKMVRVLDYTKRALDDMIGKARRSGEDDRVRVLTGLKNDLVSELDEQVPDYATARGIYARGSALKDAGEAGEGIFNTKADDVRDLVGGMGESEKTVFKLGAIKAIRDKVELAGESHNSVRRFLNSTANKRKLRQAFDSDESFEKFMKEMQNENTMRETMDKVLSGSHTARIQAELAGMKKGIDAESMLAASSGDPTFATALMLKKLANKGDVSPETLNEIAKLLLAQGMRREEVIELFTRTNPKLSEFLGQVPSLVGRGAGLLSVPAYEAAKPHITDQTGLLQ
jgi:hypothetical protein